MPNAPSDHSNASPIAELADASFNGGRTQVLENQPMPVRQNRLAEEALVNPWREAKTAVRRNSAPVCMDHAAPLSPLRDRDLVALGEFFDRDDLSSLEQDVKRHLLRLFPEPCWEDALSFLKEYL